ncbi:MAG TPA: methyltransferase domain-containing protein [Pyrinomonadaceae bacterium]|nr:methyltransferase domain-containing protein [Pyrinomonadaceae bacterium]
MHEIRATVAQRREITSPEPNFLLPTQVEAMPVSQNGESAFDLQPQFEPHPNSEYHVNDFLKYHGAAFVRNAYLGLLKRPADPLGADHCLAVLASGQLNKLDVLAQLHSSPEGKAAGVTVDGLALPAFIRRIQRVPYLGYLVGLVIAVARLPNLHRQLRQSEFHLLARQDELIAHYDSLQRRLSHEFGDAIVGLKKNLEQRLDTLRVDIVALQQELNSTARTAVENERNQRHQIVALKAATNELRTRLDTQQHELTLRQRELSEQISSQTRQLELLHREVTEQLPRASLSPLLSDEESQTLDRLYAAFEDQFRGDRQEIKSRVRVYVPVLRDAGIQTGVLDLGCGRGEWLELMRDEGIDSYGVDHNQVFVRQCRQLDLDVIESDVIHHLQTLPDSSLSAITAFHIVEHVSFPQLLTMLNEITRVLRSEGMAILETPNPENFIVGSHTFYTDPTHRNPIPSATLKFLLESCGLTHTEVLKLRPWDAAKIAGDEEIVKRFNEYFYGAPDYAIVARKL